MSSDEKELLFIGFREPVKKCAQETVLETVEERPLKKRPKKVFKKTKVFHNVYWPRHFHLRHTHVGKGRPTSGGS